jgi:REP element-mobilizing transposase RayT
MGHTYTNLLIHAVFGTKDRRPAIHDSFRPRLYQYLSGLARHEFGQALTIGGTADHVHGLLVLRADASVAEAMKKWKSLSSGWVHKTFAAEQDFGWQDGYGAFSVSRSLVPRLVAYIGQQEQHHRKMTFEEEFRRLLARHGIESDDARLGE